MRALLTLTIYLCPLILLSQTLYQATERLTSTLEASSSNIVSAKTAGAKGDGVTDDTVPIQSAIDLSFGPASAPHGRNYYSNHTLYFPAGHYIISSPLVFTKLQGARIIGDGRFTTTIENRTGTGVIATNGCSYSHWESLSLIGSGSATIFDLNWDNTAGGDALQSNTFQDMAFSGGGIGMRIGGDGFMGSENLFLNCKWIHHTVAGLMTANYNALQNTIVGGNISHCGIGVWIHMGTVSIYNVGFQASTNWDVKQDNSANAAIVISGSRTESANFFSGTNGMNVRIEGVSQHNATSGVFVSHSGPITIDACHSVNGQIRGSIVGNIESSTFGRDDWLRTNLNRTSLNLSSVGLPSSYIDKATLSSSGMSYPTQRTIIAIPIENGNSSILVRGGTLVQQISVIIQTAGSAGTINVGDDSRGKRFINGGDLTRSSIQPVMGTYYSADNHIVIACSGAKGAVGYVAVDYQHVALPSAW